MTTNCTSTETIIGELYLGTPRRLDYTILSSDGSQVLFHNGDESYRVFFEPFSTGYNLFLQYHNEQSVLIKEFTQTEVWFYKANEMSIQASAAKPIEVIRKIDCTVTYAAPEPEPKPAPNREDYVGRWFKRDNMIIQPIKRSQYDDESMYCKYFQLRSFDNEDWDDQGVIGYADFALFRKIDEKIRKVVAVDEEYIIDTFKEISPYEAEQLFDEWIDLQYNGLFNDGESEE